MMSRLARVTILLVFLLSLTSTALNAQQTHAIAQSPSLTGTVLDPAGRAIASAKVTLSTSDKVLAETLTNHQGRFAMSTTYQGPVTLIVQAIGFSPRQRSFLLSHTPMDMELTLDLAGVQQSVIVNESPGYAALDAAAGTKVNLPLMETPVSVHVIPQQLLQDQQTVKLIDALVNVSGVAPTNDAYNTSDSFSIRGYDANSLLYQDGIRLDENADSGFSQDMANVEQVEIVKGPASVLYGQGQPGGLVNVTTRKPQPDRFGKIEQQFGGHSFFRTVGDLNLPFDSAHLMMRLVFDGLNAGSFRNFIHTNEAKFFPSITWHPNQTVDLTIRGSYGFGSDYADNGIPFIARPVSGTNIVAEGRAANVPLSGNFVDSHANWERIHQFDIRPTLTVRLAENSSLRLTYKYLYVTSPEPLDEFYAGDADSNGDLGRFGFLTDYSHHKTDQVVADLPGKFPLGKIKNTFLLGFDFTKDFGAYDYNTVCPAAINIYAPDYNQPILTGADCPGSGLGYNTLGYLAYGGYIQDLAELPWRIFVLGGVRMNWAKSFENFAGVFEGVTDVHERPANPRAGLLWQANDHVSIYGSYSSNYGSSALGSNSPGQKFLPPESADQVEFGAKTEWLDRRLTASTAIYRIIKHNVPAPDPSNPEVTIAIGTARTQGVEFDVAGQVTNDLRVIASYSSLQAVTTSDTNSIPSTGIPSEQGLAFPSVPHVTGSLWATWEPRQGQFKGLRLGGGLNGHAGEQAYQTYYGVNFNPLGLEADRTSSTAIVHLMAGYEHAWSKALISAQVNIGNLTNRHYFSNVNVGQAQPGAPFNILPALEIKF
jgi:iron complex outermembrane receptor protein